MLNTIDFTSEEEIRRRVAETVKRPVRALTEKQIAAIGIEIAQAHIHKKPSDSEMLELAERWANRLIAMKRKSDKIMTSRQLADWRAGRRLALGDRARFIGQDRDEEVKPGLVIRRPFGQIGTIIDVDDDNIGKLGRPYLGTLITFRPSEGAQPVIDLQLRELTKGWLDLERLA